MRHVRNTRQPSQYSQRQWRIQGGGGGSRGSGPPPFGPRCRLFNIGPKVGPPPFVNVQEWGCFSIFLRANDVTRTMSKGGGALVNVQEWGCFSIFLRANDVTWTMSKGGGACEKSCICAWPPPPLSKILDPRLQRAYNALPLEMTSSSLVQSVSTYVCVYIYICMYMYLGDRRCNIHTWKSVTIYFTTCSM